MFDGKSGDTSKHIEFESSICFFKGDETFQFSMKFWFLLLTHLISQDMSGVDDRFKGVVSKTGRSGLKQPGPGNY